jgi:hypothetical protein
MDEGVTPSAAAGPRAGPIPAQLVGSTAAVLLGIALTLRARERRTEAPPPRAAHVDA